MTSQNSIPKNLMKKIAAGALLLLVGIMIGTLFTYNFMKTKPDNSNTKGKENSVYVDSVEQKKQEFDNTLRCQTEGERYIEEEYKNKMKDEAFLSDTTIYSPILNACVIKYGSVLISETGRTQYMIVFNLNTRKEIYSYTFSQNKDIFSPRVDILGTREEYEKVLLNLFGTKD